MVNFIFITKAQLFPVSGARIYKIIGLCLYNIGINLL